MVFSCLEYNYSFSCPEVPGKQYLPATPQTDEIVRGSLKQGGILAAISEQVHPGHPLETDFSMRLFTTALLITLLVGCGPQSSTVSPSDSWVVESRAIEAVIDEVGVIESRNVFQITAPFRGRIVRIQDDGTAVKKGDVVAVLEVTELRDRLTSQIEELKTVKKELEAAVEELSIGLRSNALDLSASVTQLDLARVELAEVNQNLSELERLRSANIVDTDSVLSAESELLRTQTTTLRRDMDLRSLVTGSQTTEQGQEVAIQRLELRGQDRLNRIEETASQIKSAEIIAPADGIFIREKRWNWQMRRRVERQVGEEPSEGELLGIIPDLNSLIVRTQVPESEMMRVAPGTEVRLLFDSLGGLTSPGVVTRMAPVAIERETSAGGQVTASGEMLSGEKVFEIEVEIKNPDTRMKPGLTARAQVVLNRTEDVLAVPLEAVTTEGGRHYVRVQNGRDWVDKEVEVGSASDRFVEIRSGLSNGDVVFTGTLANQRS